MARLTRFSLLVIGIVLLLGGCGGGGGDGFGDASTVISDNYRALMRAFQRSDTATLIGYYAGTYQDESPATLSDVRQFYRDLFNRYDVIDMTISDLQLKSYEDGTVDATYQMQLVYDDPQTGRQITVDSIETDTWDYVGGYWRIIWSSFVESRASLISNNGGAPGGVDPATYDQIAASIDAYRRAIENKRLSDLMALVSQSYLQDGTNIQGFQATFENVFQNYDDLSVSVRIQDVRQETGRTDVVVVDFDQEMTGRNAAGQVETLDSGAHTLRWRNEGGVWRIYGDQQANPQPLSPTNPRAMSLPSASRVGPLMGWRPSVIQRSARLRKSGG